MNKTRLVVAALIPLTIAVVSASNAWHVGGLHVAAACVWSASFGMALVRSIRDWR